MIMVKKSTPIPGKFVPQLSEESAVSRVRLLKALADPTRMRIIDLLRDHGGNVSVIEIVESFTLEQPTISHHLRILRDAGLIDCRKRGLWAYYFVKWDKVREAYNAIFELTPRVA